MVSYNIPLLFHLGYILDYPQSFSESNQLRLSHRIRHLYIPMIVLLIFQCYVTVIEFPQAYGTKAMILGPVRSGSIFIGMYCYYAAFTHHYKSTVHTSWLTVLIVNLTTQCIVYLLYKLFGLLFIMYTTMISFLNCFMVSDKSNGQHHLLCIVLLSLRWATLNETYILWWFMQVWRSMYCKKKLRFMIMMWVILLFSAMIAILTPCMNHQRKHSMVYKCIKW